MNKITGAKNLTDKDVQNIEKMCAAGMDLQAISDITGWGKEVIRKIRKGNYYELRDKTRNARKQAQAAETAQQPQAELVTLPDIKAEQYIKNINLLLFEIDKKLGAICSELNINMRGANDED